MPNRKGVKMTAADIAMKKDIAVVAAEQVYTYNLIAKSVGRDEDTLAKWRADDEDFSDRLEQARFRFIQRHTRRAKPEFLLERLDPQNFRERKEIDTKVEVITPLVDIDKLKAGE